MAESCEKEEKIRPLHEQIHDAKPVTNKYRMKVHRTLTISRSLSTFWFRTPNSSYIAYTKLHVCRTKSAKAQVPDARSEFCLQLHPPRYTSKNSRSATEPDSQQSAGLRQSAGAQMGKSSVFAQGACVGKLFNSP